MKKVLLFVFSLSIMSMMLLGFSINDGTSPEKIPNSEYKDLVISDIKYNKDEKSIYFKSENIGEDTLSTGLSYTIEKHDGKDWVKTDLTDDLAFIEIAFMLEPGCSLNDGVDMSAIKPLDDGWYRVVKPYIYDKTINVYIQFEAVGGDIINLNSYNEIK